MRLGAFNGCFLLGSCLRIPRKEITSKGREWKKLEEGKRAATNVQNGLAFFCLFSFILLRKGLILIKVLGEKKFEKVWKSVKKCEKCKEVPKWFCPLVVAL